MKRPLGIFQDFPVPEIFKKDFSVSIVSEKADNPSYEDYLIPIDHNLKPLVDMKMFSPTAFGSLHLAFNFDRTEMVPLNFVKSMKCSTDKNVFQRLHFYIHDAARKDQSIFLDLIESIKRSFNNDTLPRPWCENLLPFVEVATHANVIYSTDEMIFVIDRYPKGSSHFLCLPRKRIDTWWYLTLQDIPLLLRMQKEAEDFAKRIEPKSKFKFGFHIIPSMKQLHLHIVNEDFASPQLTYAQWNAFNTDFLISVPRVIEELTKEGKIVMSRERWDACWSLLFVPLQCPICHRSFRKLSVLQAHYLKELH